MKPVVINGEVWLVKHVPLGDASLIDRTGFPRLATTDPVSHSINVLNTVIPPLLDMVLLHEIAHAITVSYGLLEPLRNMVPSSLWVLVEEWSAELIEKHGVEAVVAASRTLGRPVCIKGFCLR